MVTITTTLACRIFFGPTPYRVSFPSCITRWFGYSKHNEIRCRMHLVVWHVTNHFRIKYFTCVVRFSCHLCFPMIFVFCRYGGIIFNLQMDAADCTFQSEKPKLAVHLLASLQMTWRRQHSWRPCHTVPLSFRRSRLSRLSRSSPPSLTSNLLPSVLLALLHSQPLLSHPSLLSILQFTHLLDLAFLHFS